MKKITLLITALFTCSLALSQQFDFEGLSYDINPDGTSVTVTGRAAGNTATEIVIPDTASDGTTTYNVTIIPQAAFGNDQLTSVTIGRNVTQIGSFAFGFAPITAPDKHSVLFLGEMPPIIDPFSFISQFSPNRSDIILTVGCGIFASVYAGESDYNGFHEIRNSFLTADGVRYCLNGEGAAVMRADEGIDISDPNSAIMVSYPDGPGATGTITTFGTDIVIPDTVHDGFKNQDVIDILPTAFLYFPTCFPNCDTQLTSVVIGTNVKKIGKSAFLNNELTSVTIPNTVHTIGTVAFSDNQLTQVTIGNSITTIESGTFKDNQLTSVTIPDNVTTIGEFAFGFAAPTNSGIGEHSVTFLGATPPTIVSNSFAQDTTPNRPDITVTVPCDALDAYANNASYNDFYAIICPGIMTTWDGSMWSPSPPGPFDTIILADDYDTAIDGSLDVGSIEIQENTILTVADNTYVQTQGDITVNANGAINVANAGSIVQIDDAAVTINNGTIAVAKTTPSLNPRDFILLSSPMTAETNGDVFGTADRVFSIIPENFVPNADVTAAFPMAANFIDDNGDYLDNTVTNLNSSAGYLVFPQAVTDVGAVTFDHTYTQGTLNCGNIVAPITYNGPESENNFNLLGNPYPSAIDTDMLIANNTAISEVYFWEHITAPDQSLPGFNTSNFSMDDVSVRNAMMGIAAVNDMSGDAPGQFMASAQGFAILADQTAMGTDVTFTNAMRVTGNNGTPRSAAQDNKLWLRLDSETYTIQSRMGLGFVPEATAGYDLGYDSRQIATTISLFSTLDDGQRLSIQGREVFDPSIEINLGFQTLIPETENYSISIDHLEGSSLEQSDIFLIDHLLGVTINLKETSHTFAASETLQDDRFTLVFEDRVLSTDDNSLQNSIRLYPNPAQGEIQLAYQGNQNLQSLVITDILGKKIQELNLIDFYSSQTIDLSRLQAGLYFFTITGNQNTSTHRVIVK